MASGSCACHYVRYTTTSVPSAPVNCHCTTCRKQAGAPYQTWAFFPATHVQWQVYPTGRRSSTSATRSFCPRCGSTLSMILDRYPEEIALAAGTLDEGEGPIPLPRAHIFLKEKASWYEVPEGDGAEKYQEWEE
ncbi:hypothetical protein NUU61_009511 [Penicillium alfredii]|uniref:CENP-V/GFA domain-containing protein n=1 Tax=Penicillium alfredii TaxID=1506179 RepID=A0A9W9JXR6_9EURO|nr:uncharacterized protein NUU61_009511 [Penicillium alfredii]KAJ5084932.1 hypothetical protein NUU61_009511 [Penicillium alfredii]